MHAGPGGCDEVNEIKLWTPLLKTSSTGVGNASSGGTPASVGHSYAFGNTEEKARRLNMGCKARGQPGHQESLNCSAQVKLWRDLSVIVYLLAVVLVKLMRSVADYHKCQVGV